MLSLSVVVMSGFYKNCSICNQSRTCGSDELAKKCFEKYASCYDELVGLLALLFYGILCTKITVSVGPKAVCVNTVIHQDRKINLE